MDDQLSGKVLWFRPASGQGMVKADDGRRFFFREISARGVQPEEGLRVAFHLGRSEGGGLEALGFELEGGFRKVEAVILEGTRVEKKKQEGAAKAKAAPRSSSKVVPKPRPSKGAMPMGTAVSHPMWGPGHVVAATPTVVSVEFLTGIRKSFSPEEIADVSGPSAPKAPEPRTRKKKEAEKDPFGFPLQPPPSSGPKVIRRPVEGEE